jgi:hypothetical protein
MTTDQHQDERQQQLDQAALRSVQATEHVAVALFRMRDGLNMEAEEQLRSADREIQRVVSLLVSAGAASPHNGGSSRPSSIGDVPLHLLSSPAAKRLLALLEETLEAAEQVDWERGRCVDEDAKLLPGESRGVDLAESVSELVLRVKTEVNGPRGRE